MIFLMIQELNVQFNINVYNRVMAKITGSYLRDSGNAKTSAVTITLDKIYEFHPNRLRNTLIWKKDNERYGGYLFSGASKFLKKVRPCWIISELLEDCLNR